MVVNPVPHPFRGVYLPFWHIFLLILNKGFHPSNDPLYNIVDEFFMVPFENLPTGESHSLLPHKKRRIPCTLLLTNLNVLSNGDVALGCCFDCEGFFKIGSLKYNNLADLWNNKRAIKFKRKHLLGDWDQIPLCKHCNHGSKATDKIRV